MARQALRKPPHTMLTASVIVAQRVQRADGALRVDCMTGSAAMRDHVEMKFVNLFRAQLCLQHRMRGLGTHARAD
jgi:hypothetical protein